MHTKSSPPARWSKAVTLASLVAAAAAPGCGPSQPRPADPTLSATPDSTGTDPAAAAADPAAAAPPGDSAALRPAVPAAAPTPIADAYRDAAARILAAATADHAAYDHLAYLTDRIGNRLSGTPALDRAIAWASALMKAEGHDVRTEPVKVPHWVRGAESAELVAPEKRTIHMLGLGGSVATPRGGITAEVVSVSSFEALEALGTAGVKDKIVLFDVALPAYTEKEGNGYGKVVEYRSSGPSRAAKLGARAVLVRSVTARSLRTPHTGALRYEETIARIPAAAVSVEDAAYLSRLAAAGAHPKVRLAMSARALPDADSANVIGELRGRERPDEVVVIGGHLDSWDVGQGAHDDGASCTALMQALTVLRTLGLTPRRTIRVVLFTNEENGLRGGIAYGEAHAAEAAQHIAAFEADLGGFDPRGVAVEIDDARRPAALAQMTDLMSLLAPIGATRVEATFSGADLIPLVRRGVAGLGLIVDDSTYFDYHHTEADTLDKVDPDSLSRQVAAIAVMAYVLADMPTPLGATAGSSTAGKPDGGGGSGAGGSGAR